MLVESARVSFSFAFLLPVGVKKGANNRERERERESSGRRGNLDDICSRSVRLPNVDFHRKTSN